MNTEVFLHNGFLNLSCWQCKKNGIANLEVNGTLIHVHETKGLVLMTMYTEALLNIYS